MIIWLIPVTSFVVLSLFSLPLYLFNRIKWNIFFEPSCTRKGFKDMHFYKGERAELGILGLGPNRTRWLHLVAATETHCLRHQTTMALAHVNLNFCNSSKFHDCISQATIIRPGGGQGDRVIFNSLCHVIIPSKIFMSKYAKPSS